MILQGDCKEKLSIIEDNSIDEMVTDPPYGYSFMNKNWDKAIVSVETWRECLRVLKPGAFGFVMCAPRQDVHARMVINLQDAGFKVDFTSIFWTYASGFPKAGNISKMVDKTKTLNPEFYELTTKLSSYLKNSREKLGLSLDDIAQHIPKIKGDRVIERVRNWEKGYGVPPLKDWKILKQILKLEDNKFNKLIERKVLLKINRQIIIGKDYRLAKNSIFGIGVNEWNITKPALEQAKKLDGSYAGFQPKPAVEIILVVMKPLSEKNYTEQAMSNGKGITWLDDCRIPFSNDNDFYTQNEWNQKGESRPTGNTYGKHKGSMTKLPQGRFPANLLVSDDVLNDGKTHSSGKYEPHHKISNTLGSSHIYGNYSGEPSRITHGDSGSFSRYFDEDVWQAQFLIVEKPAKSEKNQGVILNKGSLAEFCKWEESQGVYVPGEVYPQGYKTPNKNDHPTVKPISLMSYLITMGSREGDTVLDPFAGSGTTPIAASLLNRNYIGIDLISHNCILIKNRLDYWKNKTFEKLQKIKKQVEKKNITTLEEYS